MTPVKKDHVRNMSQSLSCNIAAVNYNRDLERKRIVEEFENLRRLINAREKWLTTQLDQISDSNIAILTSQKDVLDVELDKCHHDEISKSYMPVYKFSEKQMPRFSSDASVIQDCLLNFGVVSMNDSHQLPGDWISGRKRNLSESEGSDRSYSIIKDDEGNRHVSCEEMEKWLLDDKERGNKSINEAMEELEITEIPSPNYKEWILRECRKSCPEPEAGLLDVENLSDLQCVSKNTTSPKLQPELKKWLASDNASCATSPASSLSAFCEANETCASFSQCISDDSSCKDRFKQWLANYPRSAPVAESDEYSKWLIKTPRKRVALNTDRYSVKVDDYHSWLVSTPSLSHD